eukprot:3418227-Prymnesium_polylepis.1
MRLAAAVLSLVWKHARNAAPPMAATPNIPFGGDVPRMPKSTNALTMFSTAYFLTSEGTSVSLRIDLNRTRRCENAMLATVTEYQMVWIHVSIHWTSQTACGTVLVTSMNGVSGAWRNDAPFLQRANAQRPVTQVGNLAPFVLTKDVGIFEDGLEVNDGFVNMLVRDGHGDEAIEHVARAEDDGIRQLRPGSRGDVRFDVLCIWWHHPSMRRLVRIHRRPMTRSRLVTPCDPL